MPPTVFVAAYYTFTCSQLGLSAYMLANPNQYISRILIPFLSPSRTSDLRILLALPSPQSPVVTSAVRLAAVPLLSVSLLLLVSPRGTSSLPLYRVIAFSAVGVAAGYAATLYANVFGGFNWGREKEENLESIVAKQLGGSGISRPSFADVLSEYREDTKRFSTVAGIVGVNLLVGLVAAVASLNIGSWAGRSGIAAAAASRAGRGVSSGFGGGGADAKAGAQFLTEVLLPVANNVGDVFQGFLNAVTGN